MMRVVCECCGGMFGSWDGVGCDGDVVVVVCG